MKLHAEDVTGLEHRSVSSLIGAGRGGVGVLRHIVTMRKINEGPRAQVGQKPRSGSNLEIVPTHVRNAGAHRKPLHHTRINAEPAFFGRFLATLEKRLHAQADSQKQHACLDSFDEGRAYIKSIERTHHLAEMPD